MQGEQEQCSNRWWVMRLAPLQLHEYTGAIHVHTVYSDGSGTYGDVVAAARAAGLHYIVVTDHDNLEALEGGEARYNQGLLVVVGNEVSPPQNHYLALGVTRTSGCRLPPQAYIADVSAQGGFGFLAHPFDRGNRVLRIPPYPWIQPWPTGYCGYEVWNLLSQWSGNAQPLVNLIDALRNPHRYTQAPFEADRRAWDQLGQHRPVVGIGGLDAHATTFRIIRRRITVLSYDYCFGAIRTNVLLSSPFVGKYRDDCRLLYDALRHGRCFIADYRLGSATGFRFWGETLDRYVTMGEELPAQPVTVQITLPDRGHIMLLRNGCPVASEEGMGLTAFIEEPGVYRVEVYRRYGRLRGSWILSNPIYLRHRREGLV